MLNNYRSVEVVFCCAALYSTVRSQRCMVATAPEKILKLIHLIQISYMFRCIILSFGNNLAFLRTAEKSNV